MMIRWWEHSQKGVTEGQTENTICRAAWSQLKTIAKERYQQTQATLKNEIENHEKENIERRLQQVENRAKTDPNIIWKAREKGRRKNELDYNLITKVDRVLTNHEETKTHVEEYFKDLYQARSSTPEFEN